MIKTNKRFAVSKGDRFKIHSSMLPVGINTVVQHGNTSVSGISGQFHHLEPMMRGILPEGVKLYQLYRDIYTYCHISGSAVDLMSTLPFGEYTLSGCQTPERLEKYESSLKRMSVDTMMPELSVDYLVDGEVIATPLFKKEIGEFTDFVPHDPEMATKIYHPLYGIDPLIQMKLDKRFSDFMSSNEEFLVNIRDRLSDHMKKAMRADSVTLDPLTTIYLPRRTSLRSDSVSYYHRILPIWVFEKLLFKGTISMAGKRQRSITHILAGDDVWEPSGQDLVDIVQLFQKASLDPVDAIIATRNSIQPTDVMSPTEGLRWTDVLDFTSNWKMRALGVSEGFLSQDQNYATMEITLSVFIEHLKSYRDSTHRKLFTNRVFPLLALSNGYYKDETKKRTKVDNVLYNMSDTSDLDIPVLKWSKDLKPIGDETYYATLDKLADQGVPIGLRAYAAAGGLDFDSLMKDAERDIEDRAAIEKLHELADNKGGGHNKDDDEKEESSYSRRGSRRIGILKRDFGDIGTPRRVSRSGKKVHAVYNERKLMKLENAKIMKVLDRLSTQDTSKLAKESRKKTMPFGKV
jgi:hypothetical protein